MCDCRKNIEEKLRSLFQKQSPAATGHSVSLLGYTMVLGDTLKEIGCMSAEVTANFPLKTGGSKVKQSRTNVVFTFCPFCGVKYV